MKKIGAILLSLFPAALLIAAFGYLMAIEQTAKSSNTPPRDKRLTGIRDASTGMIRVTGIEPA